MYRPFVVMFSGLKQVILDQSRQNGYQQFHVVCAAKKEEEVPGLGGTENISYK